eukprot:TRINITY_DN807_c0_g1_i2.p1 TRINITY_DN807_c0_g1~~TRINITY_DN807_c0_g1_i2.p1  ORF type:complete len:400 (+),score=113.82 TRINITY_DN807_c0_g1_i2:28-1227(+)
MEQRSVTKIVQERCGSDLSEAASRNFGTARADGSLPMVLVPGKRDCPIFITIPSGSVAIVHRNGVSLGEWGPGRKYADFRHRVAFLVTKQACTYDYEIVACPTRDNVMVEVDLTFVFTIRNVSHFVYRLGADHFDDFFSAIAEESIRNLVRSIDHTSIYELRSSAAEHILQILNHSFKNFGVIFSSATVTNVILPESLAKALEDASKIDSAIQEQVRSTEFELKKMNDKAALDMKELVLKSEKRKADLTAEKERAQMELDAKIEQKRVENERSIALAEQRIASAKVAAQTALRDNQTKAQLEVDKSIQAANNEARNKKLQVDQWAIEENMKSQSDLLRAENALKIAKMEAESKAYEVLKKERDHQLRMAKACALEKLASKSNILVTGKPGQELINQISL